MVIFAQIFSKQALKDTIFFNFQKRPKNGQMAKSFYFWQTVSKKAKFGWFGLFKAKWQPCNLHLFQLLTRTGFSKVKLDSKAKTKLHVVYFLQLHIWDLKKKNLYIFWPYLKSEIFFVLQKSKLEVRQLLAVGAVAK